MDISGIAAVDVFIGLAFLYVLLSTACSAISEAIASWMNWRAKELLKGIASLLGDDPIPKPSAGDKRSGADAVPSGADTALQPSLTHEFYNHARVQTLFKPNRFLEDTWPFRYLWRFRWLPLPKDKKPSYLPPRVFALTVLDTFASPEAAKVGDAKARERLEAAKAAAAEAGAKARAAHHEAANAEAAELEAARAEAARAETASADATAEASEIEARLDAVKELPDVMARAKLVVDAGLPNDRVKGLLKDALDEAHDGVGNRPEMLQLSLERSFDEAMERVSGWYKRRTQLMIFVIALVVVGAVNADSFAIGQRLFKDDALRASVVAQATKAVDEGVADCVNTELAARITESPVPAPTPSETAANCLGQIRQLGLPLGWSSASSPSDWAGILGKIAGLLVTVFAILLGAPFWFDLLSKVAHLRGAGQTPASTSVESNSATPVTLVATRISDAHDRGT